MKYILLSLAALALAPSAFADPAGEATKSAADASSSRILASDDATSDHLAASASLENLHSLTEGSFTVEIKGLRAGQ